MKALNQTKHELEKSSMVMFLMMMVANVCNYLYQILMSGMLTTAEYGTLNTLLSLSIVIGVPSGILQMIATRYTAQYAVQQEKGKIKGLLFKLLKTSGILAGVALCAGLCLTTPIANILQIEQKNYVAAVMAVVALNCISPIASGALQGLKRFTAYSMASIIGTLIKLIGGVGLVMLGFGLPGSIAALWMSGAGVIAFGFIMLRDIMCKNNVKSELVGNVDIRLFVKDVFWVQMISAVLANGDILLIKSFAQSPEDAGIYASGMVIGKISMYMATAVITALFPMAAEQQVQGKDTRSLLGRAVLLGGGLAVVCALGMNLVGKPIITLLFGQRYVQAYALLPSISCYVIAITFITILMNYMTARGETRFFSISLGLGLAVMVALIWCFHDTVPQMLYIMTGILTLVFLINLPGALRKPEEVAT